MTGDRENGRPVAIMRTEDLLEFAAANSMGEDDVDPIWDCSRDNCATAQSRSRRSTHAGLPAEHLKQLLHSRQFLI
jgi:hypothetical protein